jgi:hypothetical protein
MRDQRCLCREIIVFSCFSSDTGLLSLTQISSIYDTMMLSEFFAPARIDLSYLLFEC